MSACKRAIEMSNGDVEAALVQLQKEGLIKAADRAGRIATNGRLHVYNHGGSKIAIVEVNCETDFNAKSPDFIEFCETVAMQIVGMSPQYVRAEDIPSRTQAEQAAIFADASKAAGVPDSRLATIVENKLRAWVKEVCLMDQKCAAIPEKTIEQLRIELIAKCGENVNVRRFVRWEVGEGLEKRPEQDLAAEVRKLTSTSHQQ
jgi:elongation factor Ts